MACSVVRVSVATLVLGAALPAAAQERRDHALVAPSAAVAAAWAREAQERQMPNSRSQSGRVERHTIPPAVSADDERLQVLKPRSKPLTTLYASYGVLQGLDLYSTIAARQHGAREVNPVMNAGYAQASLVKGLTAAVTVAAVKNIEKRSRKAAVITMVAVNVATAAVVAHNIRNVHRLQ